MSTAMPIHPFGPLEPLTTNAGTSSAGSPFQPAAQVRLHLQNALVADGDGRVLYGGDTIARMLRAAPADLVNQHLQDLLPGVTTEHLLRACGQQAGTPPPPRYVDPYARHFLDMTRQAWSLPNALPLARQLVRQDGSSLRVDLTYSTLIEPQRHLLVVEVYRRSPDAEARLARLVHEAEQWSALALITDAAGTITYANETFEAMTGYACTEVAGCSIALLEPPSDQGARLSAALRSCHPCLGAFALRDCEGHTFHEELRIRPFAIGGGCITHHVCVGRTHTQPGIRLDGHSGVRGELTRRVAAE